MHNPPPELSQRLFNLPYSVIILSGILIAIYYMVDSLGSEEARKVIILYTFMPLRYGSPETNLDIAAFEVMLSDYDGLAVWLSHIWTFVTYAFIHISGTHLIVNLFWLVIFGTVIAWRFGSVRFYLFSAVCAAGGAVLHLITHYGEFAPVIGASAAISGHMGGSIRFMFVKGGPLGRFRGFDHSKYFVPAVSIREAFSDSQILMFIAIWFVLNLIMGFTGGIMLGVDENIAWHSHIGGFFAGMLLFDLFDPVKLGRQEDSRNIS